ncbi:MAG: type II secretion system protein [Oscillospiraceae bacterium]
MKNKRGMTLVEVVCGLAILAIAMAFGVSVFVMGAQGYARGAQLQTQVNKVSEYFETGKEPQDFTKQNVSENVNFKFYGYSVQIKDVPVTVATNENKSSKTVMKIFTNSIILP